MIKTIIKKEALDNIVTFKFIICFVIFYIIIVASTISLSKDYIRKNNLAQTSIAKASQDMANAETYSEIVPVLVKKPEILSIFNQGISERVGREVEITTGQVPTLELAKGQSLYNPFLNLLYKTDICTIIMILLSLIALLFSYNAINGEKETGALRLIMANSIPKHKVIIGKLVSGILTIAVPYTISYILAILLISSLATANIWLKWRELILIYLLSIIFLSLYFTLGILISLSTETSSLSLVICLFLWVLTVIIIPNINGYLATNLVKIPSMKSFDDLVKEKDRELREKITQFEKKILPKFDFIVDKFSNYAPTFEILGLPHYKLRVETTHQPTKEFTKKLVNFVETQRLKYANEIFKLYQGYQQKLETQVLIANNLGRLSPAFIFKKLTAGICWTDYWSYKHFIHYCRLYRHNFIAFLKDIKAFNSSLYFSNEGQIKPFEMMEYNVPKGNITSWLIESKIDIIILLFFCLIFFYLAYNFFLKYDVR